MHCVKNEGMLADHKMFLFELFLKSFRLLNSHNLQICFLLGTSSQKRRKGNQELSDQQL